MLEEHADGIDLMIRRPRLFRVFVYGVAMWLPLLALMAVVTWLFNGEVSLPTRSLAIALVGLVPAGVLYFVVAMLSRPGWAPVQRIRIRRGVLHKQCPFGRIDSLALPVRLDLARYRTCEAVVETVKADEKKLGFRPPLRNRVRIDCDLQRMLWLGPSLTIQEAQAVADHLNEYFGRMRAVS